MKITLWRTAAVLALVTAATASAAEPFTGTWHLDSQEVNGTKRESDQLTLRIHPEGDKYTFSFAVPINHIDLVSMSYTAKLDGTEAEVKNVRAEKVGTAQVTKLAPGHYKVVMKGPNRPDSTIQLTVSPDGKMLTSESDSNQGGRPVHAVQRFTGP